MPTRQEWQDALTTVKCISVDASQQLSNDVNALPISKSFRGIPKQAQPPPVIPPRAIDLTASDLLLAIGKITTPRIQNLVDLSNLWAYFRYVWAFEPEPFYANLRLSRDATEIDFHQKTIMSDDMGVGFTAYVMERFFDCRSATDVTVALRRQLIPGLRPQYPTSPDYLFRDGQGNYFVVECKGTRQSRKPMLTQLHRGLEQVPSLVFPLRQQQPVRLVIGARLARRSIEMYIVDPPAEEDVFSGKSRKNKKFFEVADEKIFEQDVLSLQRANLFLFAGVTGKAIDALPHEEEKEKLQRGTIVNEPPTRVRSAELEHEFVGTRQPVKFSTGGERVSVFQGVSARVYHDIDENDMKSAERAGFDVFQRAQRISREQNRREAFSTVISDATRRSLRIDVFSKDGSMLRIEVEE